MVGGRHAASPQTLAGRPRPGGPLYMGQLVPNSTQMELQIIYAPLAGVLALVAAAVLARGILKARTGDAKMVAISDAIKEGAMAYMNRQYRVIAVVAAALLVIFLGVAFMQDDAAAKTQWMWTSAGFV